MWKLFFKTTLLTIAFLMMLITLTVICLGWFAYRQLNQFTQAASSNLTELKQTLTTGWSEPVLQTDNYKNILILGVDSLATRGNVPPLTDTIMLASINLKNGQIRLLSLPRDLWSDQYRTKINTLLAYGQERYPDHPQQFSQETIAELTGLPIHHTLVLSMDQVSNLIDLVGGVEVNVTEGFIDEQFPNPHVDIQTEHDPTKLYQRIEFVSGQETMNGERALQFMRSRHSSGDQGTDVARSTRQQQVIMALVKKITSKEILLNPKILGQLYQFYQTNFNQSLPLTQVIATARTLTPARQQILTNFNFESQSLPIYPDEEKGVITHPKTNLAIYQNQWVYIVLNEANFKQTVKLKLNP